MTVSVVSSSFYLLFQAVITSHFLLGLEKLDFYKLYFSMLLSFLLLLHCSQVD